MDILNIIAICLASIALAVALASLFMTLKQQRALSSFPKPDTVKTNENFTEIATMMSDGSIVWQRLVIQCDELSAMIPGSVLQDSGREAVGELADPIEGVLSDLKVRP